jgi:SNF2 family DNA or RNA helicase
MFNFLFISTLIFIFDYIWHSPHSHFFDQFLFITCLFLYFCLPSSFLGPFIVAGPLATLTNWVNEFKKWLPSCPVVLYHGSKLEREEIRCVTAALPLISFCLALSSRLLCSLLPPTSQVFSKDSYTFPINTKCNSSYLLIRLDQST